MRALFFSNTSYAIGPEGINTTGNWASSLLKAINSSHKEIEIFYAYHDLSVNAIEVLKAEEGITVIKIPAKSGKNLAGKFLDKWFLRDFYKNSLADYLSIVRNVQPDLIQIFGLETPFIRLIGETSIPVVIHIQGLLQPYLFKFYSRFTSFQLFRSLKFGAFIKAQTSFHKKAAIKRQIRLEKSVGAQFRYFFGRTDWDRLVVKAIAPEAKYYYCQELMREPFYHNIWKYNRNKIFRIFTTIRDVFYKNTDIIFEVADILEKNNPDFHFVWHIAGIDENDTSVRIMRRRGYRSGRIVLLGSLNASDIIKEMLNSDLFVLPSAIENSPNALQEAMLLGMPVIATYAGGVSSLLKDGDTGFLVPEGEPFSLAGAILEVSESGEQISLMGKSARMVAIERNDPVKVVNSWVAAYKDIITKKST